MALKDLPRRLLARLRRKPSVSMAEAREQLGHRTEEETEKTYGHLLADKGKDPDRPSK